MNELRLHLIQMIKTRQRPKHLNLLKVRMPMTAIASILHRLSGTFLFFITPFLLYIFTTSLKNNSGFALAGEWLDSGFIKLVCVVLIWAVVHHLLAGLRYLMLDLDIGLERSSAIRSAWLVTLLALGLSVLIMLWVF